MTSAEKRFFEKLQEVAIRAAEMRQENDMLIKENDFLKKQNFELIRQIQPKRVILE